MTFKSYEPGYLHMGVKYLPQMADETTRRYLFVAIDRATRWVYIAIKPNKLHRCHLSIADQPLKVCWNTNLNRRLIAYFRYIGGLHY